MADLQPNNIVIHYGEVALKGKNRSDFIQRLRRTVAHRLERAGLDWQVRAAHQYLFVKVPEGGAGELEHVLEAIAEVPGVVWLAPAWWLPASRVRDDAGAVDLGPVEERLLTLARASHVPGGGFRVTAKRADKSFPISSSELQRRMGAVVLEQTDWDRVDLHEPDRVFHVAVYPESVYVFGDRWRGIGGLPLGATGHVLTMLSGGIDSPVAAWLVAKRGCTVDFIHFTATRMQQQEAESGKIARLAARLSRYTQRSRLYLVPYTPFELAMLTRRTRYELIVFRRFMARVAQRLAATTGAQALVMGDSLGQVASQTMENLASLNSAVELPVLRPLITCDKQEIIALARRIGTYEPSIEPYKDCCSLLSQHPRTTSSHETLSELESEALPDYEGLIEETLAESVCLEFDCGERVATGEAAAGRVAG